MALYPANVTWITTQRLRLRWPMGGNVRQHESRRRLASEILPSPLGQSKMVSASW